MPGERYIKPDVWKRLYAHSGNQCAFPGCCAPIFEDDGLYTAECCHIKAANPGGPRYDASQTAEDRNGLDNLMFLCSRHHTIVDADVETYTTEKLQQIKQEHEKVEQKNNAERQRVINEYKGPKISMMLCGLLIGSIITFILVKIKWYALLYVIDIVFIFLLFNVTLSSLCR